MNVAERGRVLRARDPLRVIACVTLCTALAGANSVATTSAARDHSGESIGAGGENNTLASPGLSVEHNGEWTRWWAADSAPVRWTGPLDAVTRALIWRSTVSPAVQWGELRLSGSGEAWRVRVIVARIDPKRVHIRLDTAFGGSVAHPSWSIDHAPAAAIVAVNAGQFVGALPWGWVVLDGHQFLPPGKGPLSTAVVVDSSGGVHWVQPDSLGAARSMHGIAAAFQSYPTLLRDDGDVPEPLQPRFATSALSLDHRDARLALGQLRDGRILIALTRFDALDGSFDYVPFGLTTPEMAAVMGALGCQSAVMLDGGISSQMMIRVSAGQELRWRGIRRVPLGLVVMP
ncbi:MAG: phosphodiester glycosidase family protein [Gemmatimonadaceae bacterium]